MSMHGIALSQLIQGRCYCPYTEGEARALSSWVSGPQSAWGALKDASAQTAFQTKEAETHSGPHNLVFFKSYPGDKNE